MRTTTVHHTCENTGNQATLEDRAPFMCLSEHKDRSGNIRKPFLGLGVYFWDDNIEQAIEWGNERYRGNFAVLEGKIELDENIMFDLVASRADMRFFLTLAKQYLSAGVITKNWKIGEIIEHFKLSCKMASSPFPYKIIRALDYKKKKEEHPFDIFNAHTTFLDPCIIICLVERDKSIYGELKVVEYKTKRI